MDIQAGASLNTFSNEVDISAGVSLWKCLRCKRKSIVQESSPFLELRVSNRRTEGPLDHRMLVLVQVHAALCPNVRLMAMSE